MSSWMWLWLIAWMTGTPFGWVLVLFAIWWLADRFTFRLFPSPMRAWGRWRRQGILRRAIAANPHDRRARFELADLLLARHPREAVEILRPNLEAGDDDVHTAFVMGAALARSGFPEQAERVLAAARAAEPKFRMGEIDLELGRMRLGRRDFAGAREALERLVETRPGTVEGRWLLARALDGLGEAPAARRVRAEGWENYTQMPRFHRRTDRPFAWRLRPLRPTAVALGVVTLAAAAWRLFL
jgi:tetratricopeptide (TPR) repeat protein